MDTPCVHLSAENVCHRQLILFELFIFDKRTGGCDGFYRSSVYFMKNKITKINEIYNLKSIIITEHEIATSNQIKSNKHIYLNAFLIFTTFPLHRMTAIKWQKRHKHKTCRNFHLHKQNCVREFSAYRVDSHRSLLWILFLFPIKSVEINTNIIEKACKLIKCTLIIIGNISAHRIHTTNTRQTNKKWKVHRSQYKGRP